MNSIPCPHSTASVPLLAQHRFQPIETKPAHYNDTAITALQVIDDWGLDFRLGNVVKYLARHQKKGTPRADLQKAAEYLALAIAKLDSQPTNPAGK